MAGLPATYYRNYTSDDTAYDDNHSMTGEPSVSIATLGWDAPTGYTFKEWNMYRDGTGVGFQPGYPAGETQYAIWEKIPKPKKYVANEQSLIDVADAIRAKSGATGQLSFPTGFVNAISGISGGGPTKVIHGYSDETVTLAPEDIWFDEYFHPPTRNSFCVYLQYHIPSDSWMVMAFDPSDVVAYSCELDASIYRARFSCTYNGSKLSSITMYEFSILGTSFEEQVGNYTDSIGDWYIMYFEF